jgi:alkylation response protein AidB-like acyl-CoA dehydrogenase
MNFDFDEQQYRFRDTVRRFLDNEAGTSSAENRLWAGLAELGLLSLLVPEEHDGLGLSAVDAALAVEELGRAMAPVSLAATLAAADTIARFGTVAQQRRYLPAIASGSLRVGLAVMEEGAGYDWRDLATAVDTRNTVSGDKILVPDADRCGLILTAARFDDGRFGLLLLDPKRPGVLIEPHQTLDPDTRFQRIQLDAASIAQDQILGGGPSEKSLGHLLDFGGLLYAGMLIGLAGKVLDIAVAYARDRVQFGKPIGSFQAIKHKLADMAVAVEAGRSAAYYASWAMAENAPDRARAVSMAKAYCGDVARQVCNDAIQVHGGIGFTWELGLHRYLRRAKVLEYALGDAAFHRDRIVAETLLALDRERETVAS